MSNQLPSHGFVAGKLSPEDLERFASLFVPAWEKGNDVAIDAPDPGFAAAPMAGAVAHALAATIPFDAQPPSPAPAAAPPARSAIKGTMIGLAAPPMQPPQEAKTVPDAPAAIIADAPAAPQLHVPPPRAPGPAPTVKLERPQIAAPEPDDVAVVPRKRGPLAIVLVAAAVVVAGVGAFVITRSMGEDKPKPTSTDPAPIVQSKATTAVDPGSVIDDKPAAKAADKPAAKGDDKPAKADDKPAAKGDDKPAKADDKPAAKADDGAAAKPADKPADKPAAPKVDDKPAAKADTPKAPPVFTPPPKAPPKAPPKIKDEF